jgi:Icc-related predicted phosphoesterase
LERLERDIADLGYYSVRVSPREREALANDESILHEAFQRAMARRLEEWLDLAAERAGPTGIPIYLMPGNDDEFSIDDILRSSAYAQDVNEQVIDIGGGYELASMGWSSPTPWSTPRELPESQFLDRTSDLLGGARDLRRTILMTHVPPFDSGLDTAPVLSPDLRMKTRAGEVLHGPVGSHGVRHAIETFQPLLGVHGHIHESPGERVIGQTLCVNAGSESSHGIFRGYLVELDDDRVQMAVRVEG